MTRVLYAWELGGGLGHLLHARTLAEPLVRAGHEVVFALRNPLPAVRVLDGLGPFIAAPTWPALPRRAATPVHSYPSLLAAIGYGDAEALHSLARTWRHTVEVARADIVLADHAPTALVGLRGLDIPVVPVGSGFFIPPARSPMPGFGAGSTLPEARLRAFEEALLIPMNQAIERLGAAPLASVGELLRTPRQALLCYPELDHYRDREVGADHWGLPPAASGAPVKWPPKGTGPRVFAYLKPFPGMDALLGALAALGATTLVYAPGLPREDRQRHASASLVFLDAAVDIAQVSRECDLAVSHGGIGTVAYVLLAGKPLFLLPLQLEQSLISERIVELGAGLASTKLTPETARTSLEALLGRATYRDAARVFASRHGFPTAEVFEAKLLAMVAELTGG
jgi:UDP:flavonoid glycosyltransferase YjiC (YdhE family)